MAFKMKGPSLYKNSPMKQDTGKRLLKKEIPQKFKLLSQTDAKTGETTYFKMSGGKSTDGGKTFAPSVKTKISLAQYNKMKRN